MWTTVLQRILPKTKAKKWGLKHASARRQMCTGGCSQSPSYWPTTEPLKWIWVMARSRKDVRSAPIHMTVKPAPCVYSVEYTCTRYKYLHCAYHVEKYEKVRDLRREERQKQRCFCTEEARTENQWWTNTYLSLQFSIIPLGSVY